MSFPSHIPVYDTIPLVQFDALEPQIVKRPPGTRLCAWTKLEEVERRMDTFDWMAICVRAPRRCDQLLNDFSTAYLSSWEATLQILWEELNGGGKGLDDWLLKTTDYDFLSRGLRTLRHLEMHVRSGNLIAGTGRSPYTRFLTSMRPEHGIAWRWPQISNEEFKHLRHPKLQIAELDRWNRLVDDEFASNLMHQGVTQLHKIVMRAEAAF